MEALPNDFTPEVRHRDLVVRELDGELLIFDRRHDKAHCLSPVARAVWRWCNADTPVSEIAHRASVDLGKTVTVDAVYGVLLQLSKDDLLDGATVTPSRGGLMSRRRAVQIGVAAAVAVPLIKTIGTPGQVAFAACAKGTCGSNAPCGNGCAIGATGCSADCDCCGNSAGLCGCCASSSGISNGTCGICTSGFCQAGGTNFQPCGCVTGAKDKVCVGTNTSMCAGGTSCVSNSHAAGYCCTGAYPCAPTAGCHSSTC